MRMSYSQFIATIVARLSAGFQITRAVIRAITVYQMNKRLGIRGDVKINWLQPPYSAASCSQLIQEMLYIALECCSIMAAASSYEF